MIGGLARVVRSENGAAKLVILDLDDSPTFSDIETASVIARTYVRVFAATIDDQEFVEENGLIKACCITC